ncbi:CAP domain-containing protein [Patulibacter sp. NPDC049589]|uniref:CAP domain-containing protein n=1 Tax=Patulibacter sp. NPDC049589 TaxID=3154731 RepID=UPI00343B2DFC
MFYTNTARREPIRSRRGGVQKTASTGTVDATAAFPPPRLRCILDAVVGRPSSAPQDGENARHEGDRPARGPRRATLVAAVSAVAGLGATTLPATAYAACRGAHRSVASPGTSHAGAAVRCLVNRQRAAHGLRQLGFSSRAARAAQRHTDDMIRRHDFSHVSPGGSTIADRANAAGMHWRRVGETIAAGQRTPAAVVTAWMNSPDHRANILKPSFRVLGVGASRRGTGGYGGTTRTQVFSTPKG